MTTTELGPMPEPVGTRAWGRPEQAALYTGEQMRAYAMQERAAERERHADALRCALDALDHCCDDTTGRHHAVAQRLREMLNG